MEGKSIRPGFYPNPSFVLFTKNSQKNGGDDLKKPPSKIKGSILKKSKCSVLNNVFKQYRNSSTFMNGLKRGGF